MNYVFYDTETTGTRRRFDQILQFAAVCVDEDFREQGSLVLRCRRMAHVLPAAGAMVATRLLPADLDNAPLSHYQMTLQIHEQLQAWTPAIFIGFNSIDFDEELLRDAFYQTLLYPYITSTGENHRADILKIVHAVHVLLPGKIKVPLRADGKPTFKLQGLCSANGLVQDRPHDALSDVQSTMALAQLLQQTSKDIWERGVRLGGKSHVRHLLQREPLLLWAGSEYGKIFSRWITAVGENTKRANEMICFDLSNDPQARGDHNESLCRVSLNQQPFLAEPKFASNYSSVDMSNENLYHERAAWIRAHPEFRQRVLESAVAATKEYEPSEHLEEQIYSGFPSSDDKRLMDEFHHVDWPERLQHSRRFADTRLAQLSRRIIYFEKPDVLSGEDRRRFHDKITERLNAEGQQPWRTFARAFEGIEIERQNHADNPEILQQLQSIFDYLTELRSRLQS